MRKIVRSQQESQEKYERAYSEFGNAYNEFLMNIEEINEKYGTTFSFHQSFEEFEGEPYDEDDEDEDDED